MATSDLLILVFVYAVAINLLSFLVFAWDKYCAQNGMWRVAERNLLSLAAMGGILGIYVGQRVLRHKTWKEPFRTYLLFIIIIQMVGLTTLLFPQARNFLWDIVIS